MSEQVAVVLAAGKGTRMESDLPKVLVEVCGRPMVDWVLDALREAGIQRVLVVVGYRSDQVRTALRNRENIHFVEQTEQLGTGHAVMVCADHLAGHDGPVVVVTGDSPLIQPQSLRKLLAIYEEDRPACILGTQHREQPGGLGRIVRDAAGEFLAIIEERDATPQQRQITEVNMSTYVFDCAALLNALRQLRNDNRQGEFYVTDCPGILRREGRDVRALPVLQPCEALSVNNLQELAAVEAEMVRMGYRR